MSSRRLRRFVDWTVVRRKGSALAMVLLFLSIVALLTMITSFQSSTVRRASVRGQYGYEAVELGESAINEVASQITFSDVFPTSDFSDVPPPPPPSPGPPPTDPCAGVHSLLIPSGGPPPPIPVSDLALLFLGISCEDHTGLVAKWPRYGFHFRPITGGEIYVSMSWPPETLPGGSPGYLKQYTSADFPKTLAQAQSQYAFKSISPVNMSILSWRRDFASSEPPQGGFWQDWGVIHFTVDVAFADGKMTLGRQLQIDRMWSLYLHFPATTPDTPVPPNEVGVTDPYKQFVHFIQSRRNLKTVIIRS